jgi:abortive infection bacteriophage resistance protein
LIYEKPATTIAQQIVMLTERGMLSHDPDLVERWLRTVGYYRLSAYWHPYELPAQNGETRSKNFKPDTNFEDIVDIYVFDRKLRLLMMEAIERVEISLRSRWTNRLSLETTPHAHTDPRLFNSGWDHVKMLSKLCERTEQSRELFVEHYRNKYCEPFVPPLWVVTELMTLGQLSHWLSATRDLNIRSAVAKDMGMPSGEVLESIIKYLSYIRNICAHHSRLWNRRTVKRLPMIKRFRESMVIIQSPDKNQFQPENLVYNCLVVLIMLLRHQSPDTTFASRVAELVSGRAPWQMKAMGFPDDWLKLPVWAKISVSRTN